MMNPDCPLVIATGASSSGSEAFLELLRGLGDPLNLAILFSPELAQPATATQS